MSRRRQQDLAFLGDQLPMTKATELKSADGLTANWWDYAITHEGPKGSKGGKGAQDALKRVTMARVRRDMAMDLDNPQQLLPREYRYVNDTVSYLHDLASLKESTKADGMPHNRVNQVIGATNNFMREEMKYTNGVAGFRSDVAGLIPKIDKTIDKFDAITQRMADDAMEADMIMGD